MRAGFFADTRGTMRFRVEFDIYSCCCICWFSRIYLIFFLGICTHGTLGCGKTARIKPSTKPGANLSFRKQEGGENRISDTNLELFEDPEHWVPPPSEALSEAKRQP